MLFLSMIFTRGFFSTSVQNISTLFLSLLSSSMTKNLIILKRFQFPLAFKHFLVMDRLCLFTSNLNISFACGYLIFLLAMPKQLISRYFGTLFVRRNVPIFCSHISLKVFCVLLHFIVFIHFAYQTSYFPANYMICSINFCHLRPQFSLRYLLSLSSKL